MGPYSGRYRINNTKKTLAKYMDIVEDNKKVLQDDKMTNSYIYNLITRKQSNLKIENISEWYIYINDSYRRIFDNFIVLKSIKSVTNDEELIKYNLSNLNIFYNIKLGNGDTIYQYLDGIVIEHTENLTNENIDYFQQSSVFSELLYCDLNNGIIVYKEPFALIYYNKKSNETKRVFSYDSKTLFDNNVVGNNIFGLLNKSNGYFQLGFLRIK